MVLNHSTMQEQDKKVQKWDERAVGGQQSAHDGQPEETRPCEGQVHQNQWYDGTKDVEEANAAQWR